MSDDAVGITDIDCTPRPRWRETPEAFAQRMARLGLAADGLTRLVALRNRNAALRTVSAGEHVLHYTMCACSWRGLLVSDPEVARREYDEHACVVAENGDSIHRVYRGPQDKRPRSSMVPAISEERVAEHAPVVQVSDETEQRMALLELK